MDDDELAEAGISKVQPTAEYDTFGSTAAEMARKQAQAEASARAGGQLSFLPDDIIAPVADSMGKPLYRCQLVIFSLCISMIVPRNSKEGLWPQDNALEALVGALITGTKCRHACKQEMLDYTGLYCDISRLLHLT